LWSPASTPNYLADEEKAKIEKGIEKLINSTSSPSCSSIAYRNEKPHG